MQQTRILLTGSTGLIGGELLRLLLATPARVWSLVRADSVERAAHRVLDRLQRGTTLDAEFDDGDILAVPGDLTMSGLGLASEHRRELANSVDTIIHCAAETSFIREEACHRINIGGMQNLIDFARECRRDPFVVHISTATVCGAVRDTCVDEDYGCDPAGDHYNEYTRSKSQAELMLRASGLNYLILRPSIVVSAGIRDEKFARAMLWWLPLLNQLEAVPMTATARLDLVTVSYVAQSILSVMQTPSREFDCYHISAGAEDATQLGQAANFIDSWYQRAEPLKLIPPAEWTRELHRRYVRTPEQRKVLAALRHYLPFLNMNVAYDSTRLRQLLGGNLPVLESFDNYAGGLLEVMSPELMPES